MKRGKQAFFRMEQLVLLADSYKTGKMSLLDVCNAITDSAGHRIMPSPKSVIRYWDAAGINYHRSRGASVKKVPDDVEIGVLALSAMIPHQGVTKIHDSLMLPEWDDLGKVSFNDVRKVFARHDLYAYHRNPEPMEVPRCRYEADVTNAFWHTDLHFFHRDKKQIIIAFIDDRSRKCLSMAVLTNKEARLTAQALQDALSTLNGAPLYAIWTDCGTEFKGEFETLLDSNNIRHVTTVPYNPQQNGKCERFWRNLEQAESLDDLPELCENYNTIPHIDLPIVERQRGRGHLTPNEAYELGPAWDGMAAPTWTIDGVSRAFP